MTYLEFVVLTGVSRGIGFETAKLLLPQGIKILGIAQNPSSIENARQQLAKVGEIHFLQGDVGEKSTAQRVAQWVQVHWGKLDCLINNAGVQTYTPSFFEEDLNTLEDTMRVNVYGPHYFMNALIPLLRKGTNPRIINVASGAGTREAVFTTKDMPSYRISKYTLNALTKGYSNALKGKIAVNSLDPGWLKTDLGGLMAPGDPLDGAERILALLRKPWAETGKFWYGEKEIEF